ncbi:glycosyltransferase [Paenarthrobacter nitroguajacolicus]|uniref:glycosyltransferase family protein n=1 Tax=Paenarthrobacter nitroguajacolicus TaxID=211146 RepID=UPI0028653F07|nr:glycosyltransferase [Paenarthrobacter nitroguajacolicus]MDR6639847.1 spore maturation protein CgeB [Paenarthrobacter nitroguajacolicus]
MIYTVGDLRKAAWHFRAGGFQQMQTWLKRQRALNVNKTAAKNIEARAAVSITSGEKQRRLTFPAFDYPPARARRDDLTVAVILDDFSAKAFTYEWNLVLLSKDRWLQQLQEQRIDFLFVESAWEGNGGSWKYQLTGTSGPKQEFLNLMQWCRDNSIPTVFWNKEDPPHFHDFLPAAREFDVVFTSDENKLPDYRQALGHNRVDVLPFAAQPAIHNPVRPREGRHSRDVAFAGMYFAHKYPERREQMHVLLAGAMEGSDRVKHGLEIFSRQLGGNPDYQFPAPYDSRVVGSLTYDQMLTAYKAYKVFLNVNSVVDSPSMCARRIFEITASGTPVVTTPSPALPRFFPDGEIHSVSTKDEAASLMRALMRSPELNDRSVHLAQRRIWNEHTYAHRAERVVALALPSQSLPVQAESVSALVSTIRPHQLEHVFRTIGSQQGVNVELVLLTHGFKPSWWKIWRLRRKYGVRQVTLLHEPRSVTLGTCLNLCVAASSGSILTKMDDDDYYGPNYLQDQVNALMFSDADVVGKLAHYMYIEGRNATLLRFKNMEHRFGHMVIGATIMARRSVFERHPFKELGRGEDTAFMRAVSDDGGKIYASDRYNYYVQRSASGHTWTASDDELLASGDVQFWGKPTEHITL